MFDIRNTTKGKFPSLPFVDIKNEILGQEYELSLVFIGETRSRKLNREYRNKDYPTNILSFPLSDTSGEIFITPCKAKKHAKLYDRSTTRFIGYLFIHGLFHLKGYDHGSTMEYEEQLIRKKFSI